MTASPQVVFESGEIAEGFTLRGVAELPEPARIDFARLGEPIWKIVDERGETLESIVIDVCGSQPPTTNDYLISRAMNYNAVQDAGYTFLPGQAVAVPFCLKVDEQVSVTVLAGDTPSGILKREYGVFGKRTTESFYELNRSDDYPTFDSFAESLQVGDQLLIPFGSEERVFVPIAPGGTGLSQVLASVSDTSVREQISMSIAPVERDQQRESFRLRYVDPVVFADVDTSVACNGDPGQVARIADEAALRNRFEAERQARAAFFAASAGQDLVPSTVGLIDSGLAVIGDDFFDPKFFLPNLDELHGTTGEDDDNDRDNLVDDVYGRNYYSPTEHGRVEPFLPNAPGAAHGTKMGALALGGMDLAPTWTGTFDPPLVRLKVVSFADGAPFNPEGTADSALLPNAITYLEGLDTKIVNLSLSTKRRIAGLELQVRSSKDMLFVVAAGNERTGEGNDLRSFELYPARLGGNRGEENLLTVAAHDLSGARASFSNFSSTHVDLLAPGCAVKTRTHLGESVLENGTSPATAIVSFAAGLVHALGVNQPSDIKLRLLAGTDFDAALKDDAYSSGRLNIVKAISVFHDVVELTGGSSLLPLTGNPLLFGTVNDPNELLGACVQQASPESRILKIIPNVGLAPAQKLEYWTEIAEELIRHTCQQSTDAFDLIVEIDGQERRVPIADIKEVIFGTHISRR
ncbi:S8 family serine peptidase [Paracoccus actinidiae]|uniref:S8 family serine peptidase n=1 Tax=Paracoccus actinidiae TaxID=3064531 RepID=UPI0027D22CED|nr:S8 family serine peptidase [Paracoccus sp. M09]